jgi:predicted ATPase/DNA-binding SARP family transcriptional activator
MEFRLLGPLELAVDGRTVELPAGKARVLLALLLVEAGRVVSAETLVDRVWGGRPPASGAKIVQGHVSRLRKLLPARVLETRSPGYLLRVPDECIDLARFERHRSDAVALTGRGEHAAAAARLREALGLWRGPALADVADELALAPVARRLDELRLVVLEQRLEAELAAGAGAELVPELEALVVANPLRERLRARLMVALYRAGRQADALVAYREARSALVDELGLDPSESLQQLETAILNHDPALDPSTPPLRTVHGTNLPVPASSFVGRERELEELGALVHDGVRLLTLTGPGGSGKTRLALAVVAAAANAFPDGVWWVPLASVRDPGLVLSSVALALGVPEQTGRGLEETLIDVLSGGRRLLLLDNLEQLLPSAAQPVATLRDAGAATVVVTSRERLRLSGERVYPVNPLSATDAAELFSTRTAALGVDTGDPESVAELCSRLDNLPLAVELAASRAIMLTPAEMVARLGGRLDQLRGDRDADPRQQTLRATIAWSHDLLDEPARELFARLAVFAGGATVDAVETICHADLDVLASLLDKSLVRRSGERVWMLETIREFALEQLEATEDESRLRQSHAVFYDHLATDAGLGMRGSQIGKWLERLAQELPNLRSAMIFSLAGGEPSAALRISASIVQFWAGRAASEGRDWIGRSLVTGAGTGSERSTGFYHAGRLAFMQGDADQALALFRDAVDSAASSGDDETLAAALGWCGSVLSVQRRKHEAIVMMRRCQAVASSLADPWARAEALAQVAAILSRLGDFDQADKLNRDVLMIERALDHKPMIAVILSRLGYRAMEDGKYSGAQTFLEESLEIARQLRDATLMAFALGNLGLLALMRERYRDAIVLLGEDLELCSSQGNRRFGAEAIWGLAAAHALLGNSELAVKLETIHQSIDNPAGDDFPAALIEKAEPHLRKSRDEVDQAIVAALKDSGRELTMQTAISELERHGTHPKAPAITAQRF